MSALLPALSLGHPTLAKAYDGFGLLIMILVIAWLLTSIVYMSMHMKKTSPMLGINPIADLRANSFATELSDALHTKAGFAATSHMVGGGFSPEAPSFWESNEDRESNYLGSGIGAAVANAFAGTPWEAFEAAVYPKLTSQMQARYVNASTAEKVNILTGAAAAFGVAVPAVPADTSSFAGMKMMKHGKAKFGSGESLEKKLYGH